MLSVHFQDASRFPHILLTGEEGSGRSLMARVICRELGAPLRVYPADLITGLDTLFGILQSAKDGQVLILEDLEDMPWQGQIDLWRAAAWNRYFCYDKNGFPNADDEPLLVELSRFTLIATAMDRRSIPPSLYRTFGKHLKFDKYSQDEIRQVVIQAARRLGATIEDDAVETLCKSAVGSPAVAAQLLECSWNRARASWERNVNPAHVRRTFEIEGVEVIGVQRLQQQLLIVLSESSEPLGRSALQSALDWPVSVFEQIERSALSDQYIEKVGQKLSLTEMGRCWNHALNQ